MKREADHITPHGLRMWFEELVYLDSYNGAYKPIGVDKNGYLFSWRRHRYVKFNGAVQEAYIAWKNKVAESALLDSTDTKN